MLNFKPVNISDKNKVSPILKRQCYKMSEMCFGGILLWSPAFSTEYALYDGGLFIKYRYKNKTKYVNPLEVDLIKGINIIMAQCEKEGTPFLMGSVSTENVDKIKAAFGDKFKFSFNRDVCDYLYETSALTSLSGKKLHSKRNHINKFKALYGEPQYQSITKANIDRVKQAAKQWYQIYQTEDKFMEYEKNGLFYCLEHFDTLEQRGGFITVNGEIAAFTVGEAMCEGTFVVHFEKAFREVEGAYTVINNEFVKNECQDFKYINREEDMGLPGLRKAKLSYYPVELIEKHEVSVNDKNS